MLIERGDVMFVRNDITHHGCESYTNPPHHRIHYFVDLRDYGDKEAGAKKTTQFVPVHVYNEEGKKLTKN